MSRPSALYTFLKPKAVAVEEPVVELPTSPTLDQSVQTRILLQSSAINTLLDGFVSKVDASAEQLQDLSNQVKEQQSFNAVVSADQEKRAKVFEAECSARDERLQAGLERLQNTVEIQGREVGNAHARIHNRIDGLELSLKTITHQLQTIQAAVQPLAQLAPLLQHVIELSTNIPRAPQTYRNPPSSLSNTSASAGSSSSIPESRNSSSLVNRSDQSASSLSSTGSAQRIRAVASFQPQTTAAATSDQGIYLPPLPSTSARALPIQPNHQPAQSPASAEKRKRDEPNPQTDHLFSPANNPTNAPTTPRKLVNPLRSETSAKKSAKKRRILIPESQEHGDAEISLEDDLRSDWPDLPDQTVDDDDETQYEED